MTSQLGLFDYTPKSHKPEIALDQELESIPVNKDAPNTTLADLVPGAAFIELNRSYPIRASHVSRILRLVEDRRSDGAPIKRDDIAEELSISSARVQATINVMRRCQLVRSKNAPTPFGSVVHAFSPHLDDARLLWLLHFLVASDANLVLWSHLFNRVLLGVSEISVVAVTPHFSALSGKWSASTLKDKVPKEIGGILRTYAEEIFAPLGVVVKRDVGTYDVFSNTAIIPPLVWLACLLVYRDRYYPGVPSLEVSLIVDGNFSPGRILRQGEAAARRALDELHDADMLTVETRSGLDQVRFKRDVTWLGAATRCLEGQTSS